MRRGIGLIATAFVTGMMTTHALADCTSLKGDVASALAASDQKAAEATIDEIEFADDCHPKDVRAARRVYGQWLLDRARALAATPTKRDAAEALVDQAVKLNVLWTAAFQKGEFDFARKDFVAASAAYDKAFDVISVEEDAGATQSIRQSRDYKFMVLRAGESKTLALASSSQQKIAFRDIFGSGENGFLGSVAPLRGPKAERVPVPIEFVYNSTEFTPVGRQAAEFLLDLLKRTAPVKITLVGHTDFIGSDEFNQVLSEQRAKKVAEFLKSNQITAEISALGKGKREPRELADPSVYTQDQINELNRRVEFSWSR